MLRPAPRPRSVCLVLGALLLVVAVALPAVAPRDSSHRSTPIGTVGELIADDVSASPADMPLTLPAVAFALCVAFVVTRLLVTRRLPTWPIRAARRGRLRSPPARLAR